MGNKIFTSAVILAAGVGSRMMSDITKQKMIICGKSVLYRSAAAFERAETVDEIVVVCRAGETDFAIRELSDFKKVKRIVIGGATRRESAERGFGAISEEAGYVAIHDAARCVVTPKLIDRVCTAAYVHRAASAAAAVTDTVKRTDGEGFITETVPRDRLLLAQTPQIFEKSLYESALGAFGAEEITDDNMLIELSGVPVYPVVTDEYNFKITTRKDIEYAEFLIRRGYINE